MNYVFVRRVAVVVIIAFTFMVISPQYSFSQNWGIRDDLEAARLLYENGNYDEAQVKIKSVVDKIGDNKQYIEELCTAYYLRAKIRFELDEKTEMKEALKKLYQTNLHFDMPQNEDAEFLKIAYEEQEKVRAETPPKPEPVIIEINSTSPESVKVCVDKLDLNQAKSFSKNGIELDIKPGKHVFYFISENKYLKEEMVVKTGDILDFNLDFSKAPEYKVSLDGNIIPSPGHK